MCTIYCNEKLESDFQSKLEKRSHNITEEDGQKISFLKSAKNVFFRAQNISERTENAKFEGIKKPNISHPKVLLKDQKLLNLRRIRNG